MKKFAFNVLSSATLLATAAVPVVATVSPIAASAATKDTVIGAIPAVSSTGNVNLGQVKISEDGDLGQISNGDVIVLTLPSGVKWNGLPTVTGTNGLTATPRAVSDQVVNLTVQDTTIAAQVAAQAAALTTAKTNTATAKTASDAMVVGNGATITAAITAVDNAATSVNGLVAGESRIVAMSFCEPRSCIGRLSS